MSEVARTLRAVAEALVPGSGEGDPTEGAAEIEAERFVSHYLEHALPGLAAQTCALLDAEAGGSFAALSPERRREILGSLIDHEAEPMRALAGPLVALSVAAVYSEWSGQDADGVLVREPLGWDLTGYRGPVRARPELLR